MRRKHTEHARTSGVAQYASHNPLYRRSDRIQATAKNVVVTLMILMLPVAAWIGMSTLSAQQSRVAAQQTTVQQVTATTTADADAPTMAQSEFGSTTSTNVDATWTFDGAEHTGEVSVTSGTAAGTQTRIWVDADGDRTAQPTTDTDAVAAGLFTGIGSFFMVTMTLFGVYAMIRFRLDTQREKNWDRAIKEFLDENTVP